MSENDREVEINPGEYAALSNFFRGYLHQDAPIEYGSLTAAAHAFRRDADERETTIVRSELERLMSETEEVSDSKLASIMAILGASWHFRTRKEVEQLRDALK
jgi:hypothetical protein